LIKHDQFEFKNSAVVLKFLTTFEEVLRPRPDSYLIPILGKFWPGA